MRKGKMNYVLYRLFDVRKSLYHVPVPYYYTQLTLLGITVGSAPLYCCKLSQSHKNCPLTFPSNQQPFVYGLIG